MAVLVLGFVDYNDENGTRFRTKNLLLDSDLHTLTIASSVSADTPNVTFLTHGLGGRASDWSNDYGSGNSNLSFVEDSTSLIEKMKQSINSEINMYRIFITDISEYIIYKEYSNIEYEGKIDFSKHVLIVFDIWNTYYSMERVYEQVHSVIDEISYDYYSVHNQLPLLNLISQSMGGLINMQYAIDHPKNVGSLVSLGTPYNGSDYDNWLVESIGITAFKNQPCITGRCQHSYYFCNLQLRRNTWNNVYSQNKHIKFYALSAETSSEFWDNILVGTDLYFSRVVDRHVKLNSKSKILVGDICVDVKSQQAVGYDGVVNYNKVFNSLNCDINKRSQNNFPVPHNLEARDSDFINCILNIIDFGQTLHNNVYNQNGISISVICKTNEVWLLKLTNNTGISRCFEYNQRMCFDSEAQTWNGLGHIKTTNIISNGQSTIIAINEYLSATTITVSYENYNDRYIFYGNNLSKDNLSMNSFGVINSQSVNNYTSNGMDISIVSKYMGTTWLIKITNNTESERNFYYNSKMCNADDAQYWSNLTNITSTKRLDVGESDIIEISQNGTATHIAITYVDSNYRYVMYGYNLNELRTMTCGCTILSYSDYIENDIGVSIIGKNNDEWIVELINYTNREITLEYNEKMCNKNDAHNWIGLSNIISTPSISSGESIIVGIEENLFATCIAVSYKIDNTRYIFYGDNLVSSGTMISYSNERPSNTYILNGMEVGIVGKNGSTWLIELTNRTGSTQDFYYNAKMCNGDDAQNWLNVKDVDVVTLENDQKVLTPLEIEENGTAGYIAISYKNDSERYIFYANNLNVSGTMNTYDNTKELYNYTLNGIEVSIVGKNGGTWLIELTNRTTANRNFMYNSKMCFESDAKNWSNLSNVNWVNLDVNEKIATPLEIEENGTAACIAISYEEGNYRYVFYARDLNTNGTMTAMTNVFDKNATSQECVKEGTLITLADGSQKPVEELTGEEMLLVWNLETGSYDSAPILFIDSDPKGHYEVIKLSFSDGTVVEVISEHGFWDVNLNKYVYLDENASEYIGHSFLKQSNSSMNEVILVDVEVKTEVTTVYSPVTYGHLCYYVNGMLSMPGGIDGMFNIFDIDADTIMYNYDSMQNDIEQYGLFTYEEFNSIVPISEEMFNAVNGQYLKVAIGKGIITIERLQYLANRYCEML